MSPAAILGQEADHGAQHDKNPNQYEKDWKVRIPEYDDKEERRVITGSEQERAKQLKEIKPNETTRRDHGGVFYPTKGPTATYSPLFDEKDDK